MNGPRIIGRDWPPMGGAPAGAPYMMCLSDRFPIAPMSGHRKTTRLDEYDYRFGTFFVSLVCADRAHLFGNVRRGIMRLSALGEIVSNEWLRTPQLRPMVRLDEFIVMPDHFQAIVSIGVGPETVCQTRHVGGASWRPSQTTTHAPNGDPTHAPQISSIQPASHSLARLINQFKATTTRLVNIRRNTPGAPVWQRGYHDRIIRSETEKEKVRRYIRNNPKNW
jgi:putative transposase